MGVPLFHILLILTIWLKKVLKNPKTWGILVAQIFMEVFHMVTITKDTIIGDILDIAPQTAPIFLSIGMHCLGCPSSRGETGEEACMGHGVDCGKLLGGIHNAADQENRDRSGTHTRGL